MKSIVYNEKGQEAGAVELPENVFGVAWNADMVHQVVTSLMTNTRTPVAHTKNRGDVRGGGKKPWQQKGLGRARHGSIRSPIWVGGGVTHGPRNEKNFDRKVSKKMKAKAICAVLSRKFKDGEILFVNSINITEPKTRQAKVVMDSLATIKGFERLKTKKANAASIVLPQKDANLEKSFRNFGKFSVGEVRNLNILDLLNFKYLIITNPADSLKIVESRAAYK